LPRLSLTFALVLAILEANGFVVIRHHGTSHRQLRGVVNGEVRMTTLAGKLSDEVAIGTLQAIMRQSGLSKKVFRP
jgi:predicted RNA binding protein YcfA (HicA-like mRNA interferase family)